MHVHPRLSKTPTSLASLRFPAFESYRKTCIACRERPKDKMSGEREEKRRKRESWRRREGVDSSRQPTESPKRRDILALVCPASRSTLFAWWCGCCVACAWKTLHPERVGVQRGAGMPG
jgi:hypothetical protein